MRLATRAAVAAAAVTVALSTAGCSARAVDFPPYAIAEADRARCASLVRELPGHLLDQGQRTNLTGPMAEYGTAWGDPVIALQCGKPPADADAFAPEVLTIEGIDWRYEKFEAAYLFHSVALAPRIDILVPTAYAPETNVLAELAPKLVGLKAG